MSSPAVADYGLLGNLVAELNRVSGTTTPEPPSSLNFCYEHRITVQGEIAGASSRLYWTQFYDFQLRTSYTPSSPPLPLADRIIVDAERLIAHDLSSAPVAHQVLQVNLQYALGPYVVVDGEWCSWWEDEDLGVVVQRKPWSLLGYGRTLRDAINNFRDNAARHAVGMQHEKFDDVTEDAWEMRGFVIRYLSQDA